MPELPEVETIVRFLRSKILNKKILKIESVFKFDNNFLINRKIEDVFRAGKYIVFSLSDRNFLLFHLMMTGKLLLNPAEKNKHDRLTMFLSVKTKLVFNDIRKFGKCRVVSDISNLTGEDVLAIKFNKFKSLISSKNKIIKNFLLDQKSIAGIGNIYADEILWDAGVYPLRKTNTLKHFEILKIFNSRGKILRLAIQKGGTSSRDYRRPDGSKGGYYETRKVYQRTGEKCSRCDGKIKRILVSGRSTHFCSEHQR